MFVVRELDSSDFAAISRYLATYPMLPHAEYGVDAKKLVDATMANLETRVKTPGKTLYGLTRDDGSIMGIAGGEYLYWDTKHFGYETGRIDPCWIAPDTPDAAALMLLEETASELDERGLETYFTRISSHCLSAVRAAEALAFSLADTVVEYVFDFAKTKIPEQKTDLQFRLAEPGDRDELVELTRHTFSKYLGRFHKDPHYLEDRATEMYVKWMDNSLKGEMAEGVLLGIAEGKIAGFLTLKLLHDHDDVLGVRLGEGVLAGVAPFARGRGVYGDIIHNSLYWFSERTDKVKVVTQVNNYAVQNAWTKLGFRLRNAYHTFHYWRENGQESDE